MSKPSLFSPGKPLSTIARSVPLLCFLLISAQLCQAFTKEDKPDLQKHSAIALSPFQFEGQPERFLKGDYEVYEDREAQTGRKIKIRVMISPALDADAHPDPLFLFMGGPGQGAANSALFLTRAYKLINQKRDLVMIDQRGTGASNPLACPLPGPEDAMATYLGEMFSVDYVKNCRRELEEKADLSLYTTDMAMDDIHEIRAALGYDKINLNGGSYGTRAALVYLRRHPETVRTVYIKGVAPTFMAIPGSFARDAESALQALFKDCEADPDCSGAYPHLRRQFDEVLQKFEGGPISVTTENPFTQENETVQLARGSFITGIRAMLYGTGGSSRIPAIVSQCAGGDFGPITQFLARYHRGLSQGLTDGMYLSVTCREDIPFIDREKAYAEARGTFVNDYRLEQQIRACELWGVRAVEKSFLEPVHSEAPVLIVSGAVDPVTPPRWGEAAGKTLSNSLHVIVPNAAHGIRASWQECVLPMMLDFLNRASVKDLDVSCFAETKRPPFVMPEKEEG